MAATSERRSNAWLTLAGLAPLAGLVLLGARAVSKHEVADTYVNDVNITTAAGTMVRFNASGTGGAGSGAASTRVHFVDIVNKATGEATMRVYTHAGFPANADTANVVIYVPSGAARSIDGLPVDSISVDTAAGIGSGNPIIFTGYKKR